MKKLIKYWKNRYPEIILFRIQYLYEKMGSLPIFNNENADVIIWAPGFWNIKNILEDKFIKELAIYKYFKKNGYDVSIYTRTDIGRFCGKTIFFQPHPNVYFYNYYKFWNYTSQQYFLIKELEEQENTVFPTSYEFLFWENKAYMYKKFIEFRIRTPKTLIFDLRKSEYQFVYKTIESEIGYPLLIKEEHSSSSRGIFKIDNQEHLKLILHSDAFRKRNRFLIAQELLNIKKDFRVILIDKSIVLHYWRINKDREWKPTSTGHGSDVDFIFFPEKWKNWIIENFKKLNFVTAAFDIAWQNDDVESEPYILEVSPYYQPNPPPPPQFFNLDITYGEWKKSFIRHCNYHKYHIDIIFDIVEKYIETLRKYNLV